MASSNSLIIEDKIINRLQVKETVLLLSLSVLIPFLIHLLPEINGVPMGAILLAMFLAPLIAVRYFKFHVGLLIAFLSPVINSLITGNPKTILLPLLTFQLILFVISLKLIRISKITEKASILFPFLFCVIISFFVINIFPSILPGIKADMFLWSSLFNALPGIILLTLSDFVIRKLKRNNHHI